MLVSSCWIAVLSLVGIADAEGCGIGTVIPAGAPYLARAAALAAGFPDTTSVQTINR